MILNIFVFIVCIFLDFFRFWLIFVDDDRTMMMGTTNGRPALLNLKDDDENDEFLDYSDGGQTQWIIEMLRSI